jgi:hypothetical protein
VLSNDVIWLYERSICDTLVSGDDWVARVGGTCESRDCDSEREIDGEVEGNSMHGTVASWRCLSATSNALRWLLPLSAASMLSASVVEKEVGGSNCTWRMGGGCREVGLNEGRRHTPTTCRTASVTIGDWCLVF